MRTYLGLVSAVALLAASAPAALAATSGPYIALHGGWVSEGGYALGDTQTTGTAGSTTTSSSVKVKSKNGTVGMVAVGYGFADKMRAEFEAAYRMNNNKDVTNWSNTASGNPSGTVAQSSKDKNIALMVNAYYDLANSTKLTPYLGAGIGYAQNQHSQTHSSNPWNFAYQGIVGVSYPVVPAVAFSLEYRYFATLNPSYNNSFPTPTPASAPTPAIASSYGGKGQYSTQNVLAGLTFNLGEPSSAPAVPTSAPAVVAPTSAQENANELMRSYMVFFGWNSADVNPEARAIIQDALNSATSLGVSRIQLTGHADRSGSASYNKALSLRRAKAVKAVLVELGMSESGIKTIGKGESDPLVPTPDGVREPQNRRVEIVLE